MNGQNHDRLAGRLERAKRKQSPRPNCAAFAGTMTSRSGLTGMDKHMPSAQNDPSPVDPTPKPPPIPEKRPPDVKEPPPRELPDEEPDPNPDEKRNPPMQ